MSPRAKQWIWFGLMVRLMIMPFTAHPDLFFNFVYAWPLVGRLVLDPYLYLNEFYSGKDFINYYGPLTYYLEGLWSGVTGAVTGPGYAVWMQTIMDRIALDNETLFTLPGSESKFRVIFFWKLLCLAFDGMVLACILKTVPGKKEAEVYLSLWAGSLVLLYGIYAFGQSGVLSIGPIALALFLHHRKVSMKWVGLLFALSVPFKYFPLLILPFPFLLARGGKAKWQTACYTVLPLLVLFVPLGIHSHGLVFWLLTSGFAAESSGGVTWRWVLHLGQAAQVAGYLVLGWHAAFSRSHDSKDLLRYVFVTFLLLLCVPRKIHYYVWVTPLWFFFFLEKKNYSRIYGVIAGLLFLSNLNSKQMFIGLLAPLENDFFMSFPGWMDITYHFIPSGFHVKLMTLAIFALTLAVVYDQILVLFRRKPLFPAWGDGGLKPRSNNAVYLYPCSIAAIPLGLLLVSLPGIQDKLNPWLFLRGEGAWYRSAGEVLRLSPGETLVQQIPLRSGRVKKIRLYLDRPLAGPVDVRVTGAPEGKGPVLFENSRMESKNTTLEWAADPVLLEEGKIFLSITNVSGKKTVSIPLRVSSIHKKGFVLSVRTGRGGARRMEQSVLPVEVIEEPLFLHDPSRPVREILASLHRETGFLILWLAGVALCGVQTLRYRYHANENR